MDGGLFLIVASLAAQTAASVTPAAAPAQRNPDARVCRQAGAPTGSRMGSRRICKTQSEWDLMERERRELMDRVQRGAVGPQTGG